jgi:hypothetical protein
MAKVPSPNKPLADVNVLQQKDGTLKVVACFMPDPDQLGGEKDSRAVLALDGSKSIKKMFGFGGPFGGDPNYVQLVARKIGGILCGVTKEKKVSMSYWALGAGGAHTKIIGEFDQAGCQSVDITGPGDGNWGTGTKLLPPLKYIVDDLGKSTEWTMGVIITDGIIEDLADVKKYCMQVGKELAAGKRGELKLVLIGVGEEVDEGQLEELDDMFEGTDLEEKVDIWSHGIAADMKNEADIMGVLFGELMSEEITVADSGSVLDANGNEVQSYPDGLPGKISFVLPKGCTAFTIHTPKGDVTQDISQAMGK